MKAGRRYWEVGKLAIPGKNAIKILGGVNWVIPKKNASEITLGRFMLLALSHSRFASERASERDAD